MLKKSIHSILSMTENAWYIFFNSIRLCVFLLAAACVLYAAGHGIMPVHAMNETSQAVLLIALIAARCADGQSSKR